MKLLIAPLLTLSLLLFSSCGRNAGDTSLYYSSGKAKPIVAVLPMIDNSMAPCQGWSYSEEFTAEIQKCIYNSSDLYLLRHELSDQLARSLNAIDVKRIDPTILHSLGGADFVIVTELLEQKERPYTKKEQEEKAVGGLFSIAMRVRILDVRGDTPKIVLQEVIDHDHLIPRFFLTCDYEKMPWGSNAYERTPMGMAHTKVVKELIAHAEGYIGAAG